MKDDDRAEVIKDIEWLFDWAKEAITLTESDVVSRVGRILQAEMKADRAIRMLKEDGAVRKICRVTSVENRRGEWILTYGRRRGD